MKKKPAPKKKPTKKTAKKETVARKRRVTVKELEAKANQGDVDAMVDLARMLFWGAFTKENKAKARRLWQKASEKGNVDAAFNLGCMYYHGDGVEQNKVEARNWFEEAAKKGDASALCNLGIIYVNGEGVEVDKAKARKLWEKAVNLGDDSSALNLGLFFIDVTKVKKPNFEKSRAYFEKAALKHHADAQIFFGLMCEHGVGGRKNSNKAKKVFGEVDPSCGILHFLEPLREIEASKKEGKALVLILAKYLLDIERQTKVELQKLDWDRTKGEKPNLPEKIAHYSSSAIFNSILPVDENQNGREEKANCLRLCNIRHFNDPSEGQALIKCSEKKYSEKKSDSDKWVLHHFFPSPLDNSRSLDFEDMVYCVSFTKEADQLTLWRSYGHDAKGACIEIPVEGVFDIPETWEDYGISGRDLVGYEEEKISVGDRLSRQQETQEKNEPKWQRSRPVSRTLQRVYYKDNDKETILEPINETLGKILDIRNELADEKNDNEKLVNRCVQNALIDVLFLFKDEQYKSEEEYRVIDIRCIGDEKVQLTPEEDEKGRRRLFLLSDPILFEKEGFRIILGPRMECPHDKRLEIEYRLQKNGFKDNVKVQLSEIPYQ